MLREESEYELITQGVMHLANQVKNMNVEVTVKGEDSEKYSHLTKIIYDTLRESITNSIKHSKADKIDIILTFKEKSVQLLIVDNGVGCQSIEESNGIRGIKERVEKSKGTIRFVTAPNQGFLTRIELPI
jgi:signal transduction histidine kinase